MKLPREQENLKPLTVEVVLLKVLKTAKEVL